MILSTGLVVPDVFTSMYPVQDSLPSSHRRLRTMINQDTKKPMKPKKLPLPEQVLVLGVPFRVQVVDVVDAEGSVGETAGELRLIKIADSQDTRRQWTTLLHEFFHATLDVMGASSILDPDVEEMIVQSMEHSVEQFLLHHGDSLVKALEVQK